MTVYPMCFHIPIVIRASSIAVFIHSSGHQARTHAVNVDQRLPCARSNGTIMSVQQRVALASYGGRASTLSVGPDCSRYLLQATKDLVCSAEFVSKLEAGHDGSCRTMVAQAGSRRCNSGQKTVRGEVSEDGIIVDSAPRAFGDAPAINLSLSASQARGSAVAHLVVRGGRK